MVGLVQDGDLDCFEGQDALADQVLQAARAGDDDVDAGAQGLFLAGLGDAAVDHGGGQAHGLGHRLDGRVDLGGQLAGGSQDQAHRAAGLAEVLGFALGESCHQRDGEGDGLAGAGAAAAQDVASGQGVRQGLDLDGERLHDPLCGQGVGKCFGRAEGSKCSHVFQSLSGGIRADIGPRCRLAQGFAEEKSGDQPGCCQTSASGRRDQMERVHRRRMCLSHEKIPLPACGFPKESGRDPADGPRPVNQIKSGHHCTSSFSSLPPRMPGSRIRDGRPGP